MILLLPVPISERLRKPRSLSDPPPSRGFDSCERENQFIIQHSTFYINMESDNKQRLLDCRYLRMARIWSENSYCRRRQVGALLVKDKMIISDGYNGTPSGFDNVCEDSDGVTFPYVLHAEANAITKVAQSNNSSAGSTLYVTASPCMECSKLIIQSGIRRVVFSELYRITDGLNLLKAAGVEVVYIPADEAEKRNG